MLDVKLSNAFFELVDSSPSFTIKSCNRKNIIKIVILNLTRDSVVLYNTMSNMVSTHYLERAGDDVYVSFRNCNHTERVKLISDEFKVQEMIVDDVPEDSVKYSRKKKKVEPVDGSPEDVICEDCE